MRFLSCVISLIVLPTLPSPSSAVLLRSLVTALGRVCSSSFIVATKASNLHKKAPCLTLLSEELFSQGGNVSTFLVIVL